MKRTNKATHKGSCQACGAIQKLPEGVLAKHGYTTKWGFFSGTCNGSGYRAYEKATDRIESFIQWAETKIEGLEAEKAAVLATVTEPKAWVRLYRTDKNGYNGRYEWTEVDLFQEVVDLHNGTSISIPAYMHPDKPRAVRFETYNLDNETRQDLLKLAAKCNRQRAENDLQKRIDEIQEYIRWQQKRVTDWAEKELLPL